MYLQALGHPFVFDDRNAVLDNPSIRDLSNLHWIFIGSRRFLTNFSYAVDWAVWGPRPFGFHLTNLLLHVANVLLLYGLARRLFDRPLVVGAVFAVHPLLSESVGYVASRSGLLCALFLIAGTWAFLRGLERRRFFVLAFACWLGAAASKETGLLLPALWAIADLLFGPAPRRRRILFGYLPAGLLAAAAATVRLASYRQLEGGFHRSLSVQLLTQAEVVWRYVFLWVAPVGLSVVHPVQKVTSVVDPLAWMSVVSLAVAVALLFTLSRPARFGGVWFLLLILPSSLVPLSQDMAEHRVYEACAGAALLTGALIPNRRLLVGSIVGALAILAIFRVHVWASPVTLWQDAAKKAPREWAPHYALGDALREAGDCSRAVDAYRDALTVRPEDPRARRNLAICLATLGNFDQAAAELDLQLHTAPHDPALHYDFAIVEAQRGQPESAHEHLLRAIELRPGYPLACDELRRQFPAETPPISCSGMGQIH